MWRLLQTRQERPEIDLVVMLRNQAMLEQLFESIIDLGDT